MFANISLVLYLNASVLTFGGYNISLPPSILTSCGKNVLK